jgi:hypothetical protein
MHGVPPRQHRRIEAGNRDPFRFEFRQGRVPPGEVLVRGEDSEINVLANLRRAVKHAGLPTHEQCLDTMLVASGPLGN